MDWTRGSDMDDQNGSAILGSTHQDIVRNLRSFRAKSQKRLFGSGVAETKVLAKSHGFLTQKQCTLQRQSMTQKVYH